MKMYKLEVPTDELEISNDQTESREQIEDPVNKPFTKEQEKDPEVTEQLCLSTSTISLQGEENKNKEHMG